MNRSGLTGSSRRRLSRPWRPARRRRAGPPGPLSPVLAGDDLVAALACWPGRPRPGEHVSVRDVLAGVAASRIRHALEHPLPPAPPRDRNPRCPADPQAVLIGRCCWAGRRDGTGIRPAPDRAAAVAEATITVSALRSRTRGLACRHNRIREDHFGAVPGNDIRAEAARLILVCGAIRHRPPARPGSGRTGTGKPAPFGRKDQMIPNGPGIPRTPTRHAG